MVKVKQNRNGRIELICGAMFSGKTETLIQALNAAVSEGKTIALFKPALDTRYSPNAIVSHSGLQLPAVTISRAVEALSLRSEAVVVAFDEAQFFGPELLEVCRTLAGSGLRVLVAGLERDYLNRPFGAMPQLLVEADKVTKLLAECAACGAEASFTFRKADSAEQVLLGAEAEYAALCRSCYMDQKK